MEGERGGETGLRLDRRAGGRRLSPGRQGRGVVPGDERVQKGQPVRVQPTTPPLVSMVQYRHTLPVLVEDVLVRVHI